MATVKTENNYSQLIKNLNQQIVRSKRVKKISIDSVNSSDIFRIKHSTSEQITLQGMQDYYDMRREWNVLLKFALAIILVFNIALVFAVGLSWLHFSDEWFLRIVLTTNLANILGLVYLVVKFLFSDRPFDKDTNKNDKKEEEI
jgi:hypothetical protein